MREVCLRKKTFPPSLCPFFFPLFGLAVDQLDYRRTVGTTGFLNVELQRLSYQFSPLLRQNQTSASHNLPGSMFTDIPATADSVPLLPVAPASPSLAVEILRQIFSNLLSVIKDAGERQAQCMILEKVCGSSSGVSRGMRDFDFVVSGLR